MRYAFFVLGLCAVMLKSAPAQFIDMRMGQAVNLAQAVLVEFPTDVEAHVTLDRTVNPRIETKDSAAIAELKSATTSISEWFPLDGPGKRFANVSKIQLLTYKSGCTTNCSYAVIGPNGKTLGIISGVGPLGSFKSLFRKP